MRRRCLASHGFQHRAADTWLQFDPRRRGPLSAILTPSWCLWEEAISQAVWGLDGPVQSCNDDRPERPFRLHRTHVRRCSAPSRRERRHPFRGQHRHATDPRSALEMLRDDGGAGQRSPLCVAHDAANLSGIGLGDDGRRRQEARDGDEPQACEHHRSR